MWQLSHHFVLLPQILKLNFKLCYANFFFFFFYISAHGAIELAASRAFFLNCFIRRTIEKLLFCALTEPNPSQNALCCYLSNWTLFNSCNDTFSKSLVLGDRMMRTSQPLHPDRERSGKSTPEHTLLITDGKVRVGTNWYGYFLSGYVTKRRCWVPDSNLNHLTVLSTKR